MLIQMEVGLMTMRRYTEFIISIAVPLGTMRPSRRRSDRKRKGSGRDWKKKKMQEERKRKRLEVLQASGGGSRRCIS